MRDVQHNIHRDEHVDTDVKHHQEGDTEVSVILPWEYFDIYSHGVILPWEYFYIFSHGVVLPWEYFYIFSQGVILLTIVLGYNNNENIYTQNGPRNNWDTFRPSPGFGDGRSNRNAKGN